MPRFREAADRAGFQIRSTSYYEPTYAADHLPENTDGERKLPGLDLNEERQLSILRQFKWSEELRQIPHRKPSPAEVGYEPTSYAYGDADMLYNFVRLFKPRRIVEIGSGDSTLVARLAISKNRQEQPSYECEHICIEPYEMTWLESTGVKVIRERVEHVGMDYFKNLQANDILFIDSSHVIRPFGDVLKEFQEIVPIVVPGVVVHVHDIFTPRDYPAKWLRHDRKLWNEQYLLEAFLAFNNEFEVLAATNWLAFHHADALGRTCGYPEKVLQAYPSSFWFRRKCY